MLAVNAKPFWYATRGAGFVSLILLTLSVLLGITEFARWQSRRWPRFVISGLHKNVSLLAVIFLGVHIATAVADGFASIRWVDAVVPFASSYRPVWLGLGALSFDIMLALIATSLVRVRLGYRAWRAVHWLSYLCWPIALLHGVGTGSDVRIGWGTAINAFCLIAVIVAIWWRLAQPTTASKRRRVVAAMASVIVPVTVVGWAATGPYRAGWARRAGTPVALLGASQSQLVAGAAPNVGAGAPPANPSPATSVSSPPVPSVVAPFNAHYSGQITEHADASGTATVTLDGELSGGATGHLAVVLSGPALAGGGVQMQDSTVTVGPDEQPRQYVGQVVNLSGNELEATVADQAGRPMTLTVNLQLDTSTSKVTGVVQAQTAGTGVRTRNDSE
jgi:DMSO/TMAO reductase YedYZ heme-binding membrane subunit